MSLRKRILVGVVVVVLASLLSAPSAVWAQGDDRPTGTEVVFDFVIARPLGIAGCALGTAFFIAVSPFAVVTGSVKSTAHALVAEPFNFTFVRGLGEY
jgi:hypothetical protein